MDSILTKKQELVLRLIKQYYLDRGTAPSLGELQQNLGTSTKRGVVIHLEALERKGYIFRTGEPRGIHVIDGNDEDIVYDYLVGIPILGYANAGIPLVSAQEENLGVLKVGHSLIGEKKGLFSLVVKGDSMDLAQIDGNSIVEGAYIVVQKDSSIDDGDIVVAIVENCATVKKFKRSGDMIILYPNSSNPINKPIYLDSNSNTMINGKVIKVLENPTL